MVDHDADGNGSSTSTSLSSPSTRWICSSGRVQVEPALLRLDRLPLGRPIAPPDDARLARQPDQEVPGIGVIETERRIGQALRRAGSMIAQRSDWERSSRRPVALKEAASVLALTRLTRRLPPACAGSLSRHALVKTVRSKKSVTVNRAVDRLLRCRYR